MVYKLRATLLFIILTIRRWSSLYLIALPMHPITHTSPQVPIQTRALSPVPLTEVKLFSVTCQLTTTFKSQATSTARSTDKTHSSSTATERDQMAWLASVTSSTPMAKSKSTDSSSALPMASMVAQPLRVQRVRVSMLMLASPMRPPL